MNRRQQGEVFLKEVFISLANLGLMVKANSYNDLLSRKVLALEFDIFVEMMVTVM